MNNVKLLMQFFFLNNGEVEFLKFQVEFLMEKFGMKCQKCGINIKKNGGGVRQNIRVNLEKKRFMFRGI